MVNRLLLALFLLVVLPYCAIAKTIGQDIIGPDNVITEETGGWFAQCYGVDNWGCPAISFPIAGPEHLSEFRTIVFAVRYPNDGYIRFDRFIYNLNLYKLDKYLANGSPEKTISLGNPVGINLIVKDSKTTVPDKEFGTADGSNPTYDLRFDLLPHTLNNLPAGEWVAEFAPKYNCIGAGLLCVSGSQSLSGGVPYYSRKVQSISKFTIVQGKPFQLNAAMLLTNDRHRVVVRSPSAIPRSVFGDVDGDVYYNRWAMTLSEVSYKLRFKLLLPALTAPDVVAQELTIWIADMDPIVITSPASTIEVVNAAFVGDVNASIRTSLVQIDGVGLRSTPHNQTFILVEKAESGGRVGIIVEPRVDK